MASRTYDLEELEFSEETETTKTTPAKKKGLPTVLDQLRSTLAKPSTAQKETTIKVPVRPEIALKFNTDIPLDQLDRWRITSKKSKKPDADIDLLKFNTTIIVSQCTEVLVNGTEAVDETGESLNFRHDDLVAMLGALDSRGAVSTLFERDADILRVGTEILTAAGYGDTEDQDEEDPLT